MQFRRLFFTLRRSTDIEILHLLPVLVLCGKTSAKILRENQYINVIVFSETQYNFNIKDGMDILNFVVSQYVL